jgi:hypothetical protein
VQKSCDEETRNQIQCIIKRVYRDPSKEEEEALNEVPEIEADDDEEYESVGEIEQDEDIIARGILTGEALLKAEFGPEREESKDIIECNEPKHELKISKESGSREQAKIDEESYVSGYGNPETPIVVEKQVSEARIPTAMKSRPKIPRTPIPEERLRQVRKENEEFKKNAMHIYVNEEANLKKQRMLIEPIKGEERKNYAGHEPVSPLINV